MKEPKQMSVSAIENGTVRDYEVVEKKVVEVPDSITGIAKCMNPKCITNYETVTTRFKVMSKKNVSLKNRKSHI
ncbi:MAG: hypothetical protein IPJ37_24855 [Bacteroidales bacterium]|nr:hypothetical protein [Bacteroidales bacterium]